MPAALCWWARSRLIMIAVTTIPVFLDVGVAWTCCVVYYLLWSVVFLFQLIHMLPQNVPVLLTCAVCLSFFYKSASHDFTVATQCRCRALFCSSVLNLAELVALRPDLQSLKKIIYFHENQLIYPVRKQQLRDFQFGYNQILSWWVRQ